MAWIWITLVLNILINVWVLVRVGLLFDGYYVLCSRIDSLGRELHSKIDSLGHEMEGGDGSITASERTSFW